MTTCVGDGDIAKRLAELEKQVSDLRFENANIIVHLSQPTESVHFIERMTKVRIKAAEKYIEERIEMAILEEMQAEERKQKKYMQRLCHDQGQRIARANEHNAANLARILAARGPLDPFNIWITSSNLSDVSPSDVAPLWKAIQTSPYVSKVQIDRQYPRDDVVYDVVQNERDINTQCCREVANLLKQSKTITAIKFGKFYFRTEDICILAEGLVGNTTLRCMEFTFFNREWVPIIMRTAKNKVADAEFKYQPYGRNTEYVLRRTMTHHLILPGEFGEV